MPENRIGKLMKSAKHVADRTSRRTQISKGPILMEMPNDDEDSRLGDFIEDTN